MAKSIIEALKMLQRVEVKDIIGMNIDENKSTEHFVNHKFREEIIVPLIGITNNIDFIIQKGDKYITFSDETKCLVADWCEKHIVELEDDIKKLYCIDAWSFLKRWHQADKRMDSMTFVKMKLRKV